MVIDPERWQPCLLLQSLHLLHRKQVVVPAPSCFECRHVLWHIFASAECQNGVERLIISFKNICHVSHVFLSKMLISFKKRKKCEDPSRAIGHKIKQPVSVMQVFSSVLEWFTRRRGVEPW